MLLRFLIGMSALAVVTTALAQDPRKVLTFLATFDEGTDAKIAKGDKSIYTAADYKTQDAARAGLHSLDVEIAAGQGRNGGGALRFLKKNTKAIFYKAEGNVAFDAKNWSGTVVFWLSVDPDKDIEPGFCDPIQLTDKAYNDSAIWVDFTKDERPRHFRLGVFGDLASWTGGKPDPHKNPDFGKRLVVIKEPPFKRGTWTQVAITYSGLGSAAGGTATLYVGGKLIGTTPVIHDVFSRAAGRGAIRLGLNYTGLMDDLAIYDRALTAKEIAGLK